MLQEINARTTADRMLVDGFRRLAADGSTSCGCWIYSGVYPATDRNRARDRNAIGPWPRLGICLARGGEPEEYNLPLSLEVPTVHLKSGWQSAAVAAGMMLAGVGAVFFTRRSTPD